MRAAGAAGPSPWEHRIHPTAQGQASPTEAASVTSVPPPRDTRRESHRSVSCVSQVGRPRAVRRSGFSLAVSVAGAPRPCHRSRGASEPARHLHQSDKAVLLLSAMPRVLTRACWQRRDSRRRLCLPARSGLSDGLAAGMRSGHRSHCHRRCRLLNRPPWLSPVVLHRQSHRSRPNRLLLPELSRDVCLFFRAQTSWDPLRKEGGLCRRPRSQGCGFPPRRPRGHKAVIKREKETHRPGERGWPGEGRAGLLPLRVVRCPRPQRRSPAAETSTPSPTSPAAGPPVWERPRSLLILCGCCCEKDWRCTKNYVDPSADARFHKEP